MRLKRVVLVMIVLATVFFLLSACFPKDPLEAATKKFIELIKKEGEPEDTFVGVRLAEVAVGDIITSETADGGQEFQYQLQGLNQAGWLFYLDEAPGAFYDHPGRLLVLSKNGQKIFDQKIEGVPKVNDEVPAPLLTRSQYIASTIWDKSKIVYLPIIDWIDVIIARIIRKGAVITSGLTPTQNLYAEARDARDLMSTSFKTLMGADKVRDVKYTAGGPAPNWTAVQNAMNDLFTNEKINHMTLYFVAHGNINLMNLGGTTFYASQLRSYIQEHANTTFCLIIESCHAGSWLDGLKSGGVMPANIEIAITTTSSSKSAYPDWDHVGGVLADFNPSDVYVEWSGDFLQKMAYFTSDAHWPEVQTYATTYSTSDIAALLYKCFTAIKGATPQTTSLTLTERTIAGFIQDPKVYRDW